MNSRNGFMYPRLALMTLFSNGVASAPTPPSVCPVFSGRQNSSGLTYKEPTKLAGSRPNAQPKSSSLNRERRQHRAKPQSFLTLLRPRPLSNHHRRNPPTRTKLTFHFSPDRLGPAHNIFQHLVHNVFLKDAKIPIRLQIVL